ncbi:MULTISPECIES: hypothetical protein [Aphanothece]|uniref:hypothetical protein n=1 Tax=Aphanothece TaxID=1121 RepID=UPI0039849CB9
MPHRLTTLLLLAGLLVVPADAAGPSPMLAIQQPEPPVAVCVVTPRVEPVEDADALGIVPVSRPRLIVVEPLLELRIARPGAATWILTGTREQPIRTPLDWPTSPIGPGELILLQLRPSEAPAEAFAHVHLVGASETRMATTERLIRQLARQASDWLAAIESALQAGDVPVAWSLLFAPEAPADPELEDLQVEVIRRGCGG